MLVTEMWKPGGGDQLGSWVLATDSEAVLFVRVGTPKMADLFEQPVLSSMRTKLGEAELS